MALADPREEKFCQLVAEGLSPTQAKLEAGLQVSRRIATLMAAERIQTRIAELLDAAAKKAVLTRAGLLDELDQERRLARAAGQHSAALKAIEMLGQELFGMFRKQMEIGKPGEFDALSEDDLRKFILKKVADLGLTVSDANGSEIKLIEAEANKDTPTVN